MALVINTFFDKDNVIVSNSTKNLGRNPITELYYGDGYSRYLFHFDETRIKELYSNGSFANLANLKHIIKLYNCGSIESELIGNDYSNKIRSTSFDLVVYPLEQAFDEGIGYDIMDDMFPSSDILNSSDPSNWFKTTTLTDWNNKGATNITGTTILSSYHFDFGNENPEFDITDYVNAILTSGTTNYGLCVQFNPDYEVLSTDTQQYVGFFSRQTNTFFEPYLQTTYSETIKDDRNKFYLDKTNRLYLYSNIGGELKDLDELPTCIIKNDADQTIATPTVCKATKGVYYVELLLDSETYSPITMFYDNWSNLIYNTKELKAVELEFTTRNQDIYFNISDQTEEYTNYNLSIAGIKPSENIISGDVRKVSVNVRLPFTINQNAVIDGLFYRIYIKEGNSETTVIDYTEIERSFNANYFTLDTLSLVKHKYFIDIKLINNNVVKHYKEITSFTIV